MTSNHCPALIFSGQRTARTSSSRFSAAGPSKDARPAFLRRIRKSRSVTFGVATPCHTSSGENAWLCIFGAAAFTAWQISNDGSSYIAGELADWLEERDKQHTRGAPYHPQTQEKIERWHQTLKNRILLENYYLPGDLKARIEAPIAHYDHKRYHESLNNLTPAEVSFGYRTQPAAS